MNLAKPPEIKVYSFDVFDTSITRAVAHHRDVLVLLQRRLKEKGEEGLNDAFIKNFPGLRRSHEFRARLRTPQQDITLDAIYKELQARQGLTNTQVEKIKEMELDQEYAVSRPIAWTISEIKRLRDQGGRIIFTSDMYLPSAFIQKLLTQVSAFQEGDAIYVSGEIGLTKSSSKLYQYVLEKEGCRPSQMAHCGDNFYSDTWVPAQLGIGLYGLPPATRETAPFRATGFIHEVRFRGEGMKTKIKKFLAKT